MNKRGMSFWDILAWIVLGLITLWLILKVMGIINTPDLLVYAPYFGAVYLAGWAMATLVRATQNIQNINKNLVFLNKKTSDFDKDIEIIKEKCK